MTSICYSQVKKVVSRTACGIEFFKNPYGRVIVVFAEREVKGSQAKSQRGGDTWVGP